jgi:FkbM family methyltransferase
MIDKVSENQIYIGYDTNQIDIMRRYLAPSLVQQAGYHIDGFGNRTRLEYFFSDVTNGIIQHDVPFPDNGQYGEAIEYLGTLRAIQAAGNTAVVYELGAGFAPWLVVANTFAKSRKEINRIKLVAVEADPQRIRLAHNHFQDNGIPLPGEQDSKIETLIINAGVSDSTGELIFTAQDLHDWGGTIRSDSSADYRGLTDISQMVSVPTYTIEDLLASDSRVDLMHIDIQGWESRSIASSIQALNAKVAALVIGTHSRVIEGELISILRKNNWILIYEKPCKFRPDCPLPDLVGATYLDGTQFWINTALWPKEFSWS